METDLKTSRIESIWRRYDAIEERLSAPLSERMLDLAGLQPGMHVLDLATGRGEPAIPAANRVFPGGRVLGVDADPSVLRIAQEKVDSKGLPNLELKVAEVAPVDHDEPGTFYYSELDRLAGDLEAGGFNLMHSETLPVEVMEVASNEELITWAKTFGMSKLLHGIPSEQQAAWERELVSAAEPYRARDGIIRLGGLCRVVLAT